MKRSTVPRPMPLAPPVTTATLPSRRPFTGRASVPFRSSSTNPYLSLGVRSDERVGLADANRDGALHGHPGDAVVPLDGRDEPVGRRADLADAVVVERGTAPAMSHGHDTAADVRCGRRDSDERSAPRR